MRADVSSERVAVAARSEQGQLCMVTVVRDPLGAHLLQYDGSESAVAILSPEVIEGLRVALSTTGRTVVPARRPGGGACTLLALGQRDRVRLYFHAASAFCAVLGRADADRLCVAVEEVADRRTSEPQKPPIRGR